MSEIAGKMRNETVFQLKSMLSEEIALIGAYEKTRKKLKQSGNSRFESVLQIEDTHRKIAERLIKEVRSREAVLTTGPEHELKLPLYKGKIADTADELASLRSLKKAEERGIIACETAEYEQILDESSESVIATIVKKRKGIVSQLQGLV